MAGFSPEPMRAPLMADILKDPHELSRRAEQPLFVIRYASDPDEARRPYYEACADVPSWIEATTEADGLKELDTYLETAAQIIETNTGNPVKLAIAHRLQNNLRVVGAIERALGVYDIAEHCISHVESTSAHKLPVFAPAGESESLIFWEVHNQITRLRPDIAPAIYPFELSPGDTDKARQYHHRGIKIFDDWTASGHQMERRVGKLIGLGLMPERMELNYICAAENHLNGLHDVPVRSTWTYPGLSPSEKKWVSLIGSHTSPDYGFGRELWKIANELWSISQDTGDESLNLRLPGICSIAKVHKAGRDGSPIQPSPTQDPAQFAAFHAAVASYQTMFPVGDDGGFSL